MCRINRDNKAFGGVASTLIMFIAIISVTTGLVMAFVNYVETTEQSFSVQNKLTSNKLRTATTISYINYDTSSKNLYIYVKNIGDTKLKASLFDVFVNNQFISNFTTFYADNLSNEIVILQPYDSMVIVKNIDLTTGTYRVVINSEFGTSNEDSFNV